MPSVGNPSRSDHRRKVFGQYEKVNGPLDYTYVKKPSRIDHRRNVFRLYEYSSSCAIPETGVGSSPHIPVLSVCFSCFYTGIWDLHFNAGSERLLER